MEELRRPVVVSYASQKRETMTNKVLLVVICIAVLAVAMALLLRHGAVRPAPPDEARKIPVSASGASAVTPPGAARPAGVVVTPAPAAKAREDVRSSSGRVTLFTVLT